MSASASGLVHRLFESLASPDPDTFADAMADDVVFEIPFASAGAPVRIVGREAVRAHLAERWASRPRRSVIHAVSPAVQATADPELFLVETDLDLTRPDGVRVVVRSSVNVVRVRDGAVTLFRDYMNGALIAALAS